jgi:hypothetical protein
MMKLIIEIHVYSGVSLLIVLLAVASVDVKYMEMGPSLSCVGAGPASE